MTKYKKKTKFSLDDKISNSKFDYCKNLKWFIVAPILICILGVILLCTVGFNLGIDFTGGSITTVYMDSEGTYTINDDTFDVDKDMAKIEAKINKVLAKHELKATIIQKTTADELGIANGDAVIVKYQNNNELESADIIAINEEIRYELLVEFGYVDGEEVSFEEFESEDNASLVSNGEITTASASSELMMKSFIALLVAVVLILVYVAIRFDLTGGLAAILALFHDILITASVVLICRIQINVAFIAALITILGYSINNTIIIFDKMREELRTKRQANEKIDNRQIANSSVRTTMTRSILTALTTFVSIFMITVIGVADIREFAFPIMIGILAGFYSSVFITPGLWAIAYRPKKGKVVTMKKETEVE
ncbi:MAG: protein translocase subunit SecF [Clostridia bacterium]|nr:protein translocase subunit SecF [Clostridia bacterium]